MKAKSLAVSIITALILVIAAYSASVPVMVQAWLGITSFALSLVLSTFFPSGILVAGWDKVLWLTNIAGIVLHILNAISDKGLLPADVINQCVLGVNIFVQAFLKDYTASK